LLSLKASEWQTRGMGNEEVFLFEYQYTVKVRSSDPLCNFGMQSEFAAHWPLRTQSLPWITLDVCSASVFKETLPYSERVYFFLFFFIYPSSIY